MSRHKKRRPARSINTLRDVGNRLRHQGQFGVRREVEVAAGLLVSLISLLYVGLSL